MTTANRRILYRGSLIIPESHLVLDGLTFSLVSSSVSDLQKNELALTLESMSGRAGLDFLGLVDYKEQEGEEEEGQIDL